MKLPASTFTHEARARFDEAIHKEWMITNGLGGYASSTILDINTRKYHGLIVAAFHPPGDRRVCLEKLDEEVNVGNSVYPLGASEFQNGIFPQGYGFLREFTLSPFPKHFSTVQNVDVEKTVFMPFERNAVIALYRILNRSHDEVKIRVFPYINFRHFHSVTDKWKVPAEPLQKTDSSKNSISLSMPKTTLIMNAIGGQYSVSGKWVEDIYYREEAARGESCLDDWYQSGFFEFKIEAGRTENFAVTAVADKDEETAQKLMTEMPITIYDLMGLYERERARREDFLARFYGARVGLLPTDWLSQIVLATDAFVVKSVFAGEKSVIAGYPWFECWGRDAFVSLPGLLLVTGRFEDARKVFLVFSRHCKHGLIPNFVPDRAGEPVYNSVDASLWFLNAVLQYLKYTGDFEFVKKHLWNVMKNIIDSHVTGTVFSIHADKDGLLCHGPQLTWMDAAVDGGAVTPRAGKAVEIQALWYNGLRIMELVARKLEESSEADNYSQAAEKVRASFAKFWNPEKGCLFDVVDNVKLDSSMRPNQIFAAGLDFCMIDREMAERVVDVVQHDLLTPCGLRTLAKSDSRYVGVYAGDRINRDRAYHNGTVWPWLLGSFVKAFLKTKGYGDFRLDFALKNFLLPLFTRSVSGVGLGTVNEIFDGDAPYTPRGCIAQAWSVAEPLRAYVEDVRQIKPKFEKEVLTV